MAGVVFPALDAWKSFAVHSREGEIRLQAPPLKLPNTIPAAASAHFASAFLFLLFATVFGVLAFKKTSCRKGTSAYGSSGGVSKQGILPEFLKLGVPF